MKPNDTPASHPVLDLRIDQCRYPYGDIGTDDFHFCDKRKAVNSSYCPEHQSLCANGYRSVRR